MDKILMINNSNSNIITRKATQGAELDLVANFIDYKINLFERENTYSPDNSLAIFCEPQIDNAYPDVVFAEYNVNYFKKWNKYRDTLDNKDLKILYHLYYSKGLKSNDIIKQLGVTYTVLLKSIEKLMDSGLIIRGNELWRLKDPNSFFAVSKIETVEAKLNNWDGVLKQALHNTRFSSESYVLSELKTEPKQRTIDKFNNYGIGMYYKNHEGFQKVGRAKRNLIPNSYTSLLIGELIGRSIIH